MRTVPSLLSTNDHANLITKLVNTSLVELVLLDESTLYPASGSDALGGV